MPIAWLDRSQAGLTEALARRLHSRAGSALRQAGEAACLKLARETLAALREDLTSGRREAIRVVVLDLVQELTPQGLGFSDIRFYAQSLRTLVLAAADESQGIAPAVRRALEDWLYEVLLVGTMRFVAQREELFQARAVQQEVHALESQLVELKHAYEEKTRLLEVIRQASTPIAPVVDGILVVPLVGVFDTFRAQILTEKLLHEVARAQAQVVIVDLSGVPVFDVEAAQLVIRLAQSVRLLGTELILVGITSSIARTIVELGVSLSGLRTLGSLQDGLAQALAARRLRIVSTEPKRQG